MNLLSVKKSQFFDRPRVQKALDRQRLRVLRQTGGTVRRIARNSMKSGGKRGQISEPGQPPRFHSPTGQRLKDGVFFGLADSNKSVVIGMDPSRNRRRSNGKTVPELLEEGGSGPTVTEDLYVKRSGPARRGAGGQFVSNDRVLLKKGTRTKYRARPFIGPSAFTFKDKFTELWKESIRG